VYWVIIQIIKNNREEKNIIYTLIYYTCLLESRILKYDNYIIIIIISQETANVYLRACARRVRFCFLDSSMIYIIYPIINITVGILNYRLLITDK